MIARNAALILLSVTGFAVVHSLAAGSGMKRCLQKVFGERFAEGWYRIAFNLLASITIAPALVLMVVLPDRVLYVIPFPYLFLSVFIQGIGAVGLLLGALAVDLWRFAGIRQAYAFFVGDPLPLPEEPLNKGSVYGIVRHPLYLFSLLILWLMPVMSLNFLIFSIGATVYFMIGSLFEERWLLRAYGEEYRRYHARVPWVIPWRLPVQGSKE
ncbi:MAG: isoprenylcysteine carboxylmethyltransferase family protein [Anaerolineae bacterium]|nr:isoprenylcysteine carboxylmethyltransferase family protein [Anaerolineae bacterium]